MKVRKKAICLLLTLSLLLALTACSAFAPRMAAGLKKMSQLQSFHSDTTLTVEISLSLLGQELPLELSAHAVGDHQTAPSLHTADLDLELWDFSQRLLLFARQEGDELTVSVSADDGRSWMHQTLDTSSSAQSGASIQSGDLLKAAIALSGSFDDAESEDPDQLCYEGEIPAEMVQELIRQSGALQKLSEAADLQLDESAVAAVGSVPAAVTIDKSSGMIVQLRLDLTQAVSGLSEQLAAQLLEQSGLGFEDAALSISRLEVVTDLSQFDAVTVVPPTM